MKLRTQARIATFNLIYMSFFEEVNDEAFSAVFESENLNEKGCEFAKELFNAFFQFLHFRIIILPCTQLYFFEKT